MSDLSPAELEQLRKLAATGLLAHSGIDNELCTDLWLRGYVTDGLGGWKITDKGRGALIERS